MEATSTVEDCFVCDGSGLDPQYLSFSCEVCERGKLRRSHCCDAPLYTEGSEGWRCSECGTVYQRNIVLEQVEHRLNVAAHSSPFQSYESEHYKAAWEWLMIRISYPAGSERARIYEHYLPWTPEKAR